LTFFGRLARPARGGQSLATIASAALVDNDSHAIPAMQQEAATLIAGMVFAAK
jgi:hypothetical protein